MEATVQAEYSDAQRFMPFQLLRPSYDPAAFLEEFRMACKIDYRLADSTTYERMRCARHLINYLEERHPLEATQTKKYIYYLRYTIIRKKERWGRKMKFNLSKLNADEFDLAKQIAKFFEHTIELPLELSKIPCGQESRARDAFVNAHARKTFVDYTKKTIEVDVAADSDTAYLLTRLARATASDIYNVTRAADEHMKIFKCKT